MRLFIINSLLFLLATTLTLAAPVTLPDHDDSISHYKGKSVPVVGDKDAVVSVSSSSTSTIPGGAVQASDDQGRLVRRSPAPRPPVIHPHGKKTKSGKMKSGKMKSRVKNSWRPNAAAAAAKIRATATLHKSSFKALGAAMRERQKSNGPPRIVRNLDKTTRTGGIQRLGFNKRPITSPNKVPVITSPNKVPHKFPVITSPNESPNKLPNTASQST